MLGVETVLQPEVDAKTLLDGVSSLVEMNGFDGDLVLTMLTPEIPGPSGPPGLGGSEPALRVDYIGPRYWYLGYSSHIIRIDHGVSPPVTGRADSTDWAGREGLGYA